VWYRHGGPGPKCQVWLRRYYRWNLAEHPSRGRAVQDGTLRRERDQCVLASDGPCSTRLCRTAGFGIVDSLIRPLAADFEADLCTRRQGRCHHYSLLRRLVKNSLTIDDRPLPPELCPFVHIARKVYSCAGDLPLATAEADDDNLQDARLQPPKASVLFFLH
jgi:hypothetical protein